MKQLPMSIMALALAGCYSYAPSTEIAPESGAEARIHFAGARDIELGGTTYRDAVSMDGMLQSISSDSIGISALWIRTELGHRYFANEAFFYFPMTDVESVSHRTLMPAKSVVAAAVVVGAGAGLLNFVVSPGGGTSEPKGNQNIAPRVQIPIP